MSVSDVAGRTPSAGSAGRGGEAPGPKGGNPAGSAGRGGEAQGVDRIVVEVEATQGAAAIGRVVEAGAALIGRRVLVGPIDPCGQCEVCRRGGAAVCPHAAKRPEIANGRIDVAARWVVTLDDGLELPVPEGAAVAGDVALAYTLYARTGLGPREPVVIAGASPVARFLVEILLAKAITPVVVCDPVHHRWRDWLVTRGAAVAGSAAEIAAAIAAQGTGARPWRVIAAAPDAITFAASLAGPRSTLTVLAPSPALPGELASREVTIICVAGAHPDLVVEAAAMCVKGEIDLAAGTATAPNDTMCAVIARATLRGRSV